MVFFVLRQRIDSVQALLTVSEGNVSKQMAKWAGGLAMESIVLVEGTVKKAPEIIKSATVGNVEIHISQVSSRHHLHDREHANTDQIHLISGIEGILPFSVEDASRPELEAEESEEAQFKRVLLDTRLNNRVVDLRVNRMLESFRAAHLYICCYADNNQSSRFQATTCHWQLLQGLP